MSRALVSAVSSPRSRHFLLTVAVTLLMAIFLSAVFSPLVRVALEVVEIEQPLSRVFDRVLMLTSVAGLLLKSSRVQFAQRIKRNLGQPLENLDTILRGFIAGLSGVALLWILAFALCGGATGSAEAANKSLILIQPFLKAISSAIAVAFIEESFFRAFLLDGAQEELGAIPALLLTSAVYAAVHFLRSKSGSATSSFWSSGFLVPISAARSLLTLKVIPGFIGLMLLGLLLGRAFQLTGSAHLSVGLHAGVVFGAKFWRAAYPTSDTCRQRWLLGYGWPSLISGFAAWVLIAAMLAIVERFTPSSRRPEDNAAACGAAQSS